MIEPIGAVSLAATRMDVSAINSTASATSPTNFARLLSNGMESLQTRMERADAVVLEAASGKLESPHLLMVELEQARISLQLAVEVRNRLIEGYQEVLRMQV